MSRLFLKEFLRGFAIGIGTLTTCLIAVLATRPVEAIKMGYYVEVEEKAAPTPREWPLWSRELKPIETAVGEWEIWPYPISSPPAPRFPTY